MADDRATETVGSSDQVVYQPGADLGAGRYTILGPIGYGGMGEVYKARDRQLDRLVAIKAVRPGRSANSAHGLEREARLAASLDHPFICKIHELLQPADGVTLLVMEYVEGKTLRALLKEGPLAPKRVIRLAREMAEALSLAHATGLIHRDIKPANVMMTSHGHIKLMDFGIAKHINQPEATTTTGVGTVPGRAVGTPAYMSPEQASADSVDQRSDIFSFGVLLHECLTGYLPAEQSSPAAEPRTAASTAPLSRITPTELRAIVTRCVDKKPEARFQTFEEVRKALDAPVLARLMAPSGGILTDLRTWSWRARIAVVALVTAIIAGVVAIDRWRSDVGETAKLQNQGPIVTWPTFELGSRVSPDGKAVTFISRQHGKSRLWIRSVDGRDPVAIGEVRDRLKTPAWSPDGQQIAYLVPVDNQAHVQFISVWGDTTAPPKPLGGAWDDVALVRWVGTRIYFSLSAGSTESVLWRYDTRDGSTQQVTDPAGGQKFIGTGDTVNIDVRGDETRIVFVDKGSTLWIADLDGKHAESIALEASLVITPRWRGTSGRRIVYVSNENGQTDVWEYDLKLRRKTPLTTSPLEEESVDASAIGDVLVADTVEQISHLWALNPANTAAPRQLTNDSRSDVWPSLAARSDRLVFSRRRSSFVEFPTTDTDLLSARWNDARMSVERVLGPGASGVLSPDGRRVLFVRWPPGDARAPQLWIQELDGSKPAELISDRFWFSNIDMATWSIAGETTAWGPSGSGNLFFVRRAPGQAVAPPELMQVRVDADLKATTMMLAATANADERFTDLDVSPNGKALAFISSSRRPYRGGKLMWFDLGSPNSTPRTILDRPDGTQLYIAGWTRSGSVIAVEASRPDRGISSDIFEVNRDGRVQHVATAPGLLGISARLDATHDRLVATTVEGGVATVSAIALGNGKSTKLVANEIDGITFGGYTSTPDGWLLYMRKEINYNVWLFDFRPGSAGTALQGGR